jgi:hypothetical protein
MTETISESAKLKGSDEEDNLAKKATQEEGTNTKKKILVPGTINILLNLRDKDIPLISLLLI